MKVSFYKYTDKDELLITFIPTIVLCKEPGIWTIAFSWLCFVINIEF